ncbi:DUF4139 domain-containing protein [Flavobacterium sp.]|uniref:DUF4139 domain-containing protein n=1 Tax=Flavobacterium sp. TaxID=239 RepID=UPI00286A8A43|nr:DUF4139 domain-containing protein [Flavobacterium sp.]
MKKFIALFIFLVSASSFAQKPIFASAKVKAVTVYSNAAEISQTTSAMLPKGTSEIVIKNVSDVLNENTVRIGAPSTVTVLSVQFSDDYISEYDLDESNPAIKKVRDSINWVKKEIQKVGIEKTSQSKTIELLDKNQQVSGVNSGLNVIDLMKFVDYYKLKHIEISNAIITLEEKEKKLNKQLANLNTKLETNTKSEDEISDGKLILQVMNEVAGNVDFEINYLTPEASWKPFYDLRTNSVAEPMNMMYKAEVVQDTGIDWKKVKLTLSSGNPNQNNQAPLLSSWFLKYQENYGSGFMEQSSVQNKLQGRVAGVNIDKYKAEDDKQLQEIVIRGVGSNINENQLNISFDIDIPYDILSNGKAHSVALKEIKIPATYKYYAAPRVEKEAFLLAEIVDYSKYNLLKGEANIIFEGMYVGKTQINPTQTADTLNLSMGRDKKIAIKREKVADKSGIKFLSSKKEQTFTYDITVRNNKKETVQLLLKDQYPLSPDKEIEIELLQSDGAKVNVETGILTWDLDLKSAEIKKIRISYRVKYPKDKVIDNL